MLENGSAVSPQRSSGTLGLSDLRRPSGPFGVVAGSEMYVDMCETCTDHDVETCYKTQMLSPPKFDPRAPADAVKAKARRAAPSKLPPPTDRGDVFSRVPQFTTVAVSARCLLRSVSLPLIQQKYAHFNLHFTSENSRT